MSIQRLINRRSQVRSSLTNTKALKATAQTKLERLKQAKVEITQLMADTSQMNRKLQSFSISPADWQGSTEREYVSGPKVKMETAVSNYLDHLEDSNNRVDQEITRLMSQIETYNSQISSYSSTISYLNVEIRNYRSE